MECKGFFVVRTRQFRHRFNRDIVECKAFFLHYKIQFYMRFNRDIVECKGSTVFADDAPDADLIETLWNVKSPADSPNFSPAVDLIETLWNVKRKFVIFAT